MKSLKSLILLLPFVVGLNACNSDDDSESLQVAVQVVTGEIKDVGLTTATLSGSVSASSSSSEIGIAYCLGNDGNAITYIKATDFEYDSGNRNFYVAISGLFPDTDYSYYAYIKDNNGKLIVANEKKTFRTNSPLELLKYNSIQWVAMRDATLRWDLSEIYSELTDNNLHMSYGIAWSTEKEALVQNSNQFTANTQAVVFGQEPIAIVKLNSLNPSTVYYYSTYVNLNGKQYVSPVGSFVTISENAITGTAPDNVQAVDLGLPSGTKWANVNLGAAKSEDLGLFFAWGETDGYSGDGTDGHTFNWSNYKWCNGSRDSQTKYCTNSDYGIVDDKTVLDLADDAAFINWGDEWRMPTNDEVYELFDNTKSKWTTLEGVYGCMFTSTSTGNSIFLPASGCRVSESHYDEGQNGYYWSASIDQPSPYASRYLGFKADKVFPASLHRYYGMTVRPVRR
ncbi:MAG: hypothetical protein J5486_01260 [Bacteroidaceae bacterium]|nr:hypothetical protein [Bacteroidaceae bacterium]